jgi:hypothetical protein
MVATTRLLIRHRIDRCSEHTSKFEAEAGHEGSEEDRSGLSSHIVKICAARVATVQADRIAQLHAIINPSLATSPPKIAASSSSSRSPSPPAVPCSCQFSAATSPSAAAPSPAEDSMSDDLSSSSSSPSSAAHSTVCRCRVLLALPDTMMNLSGRSVSALSRQFHIPARRILLVHDDSH